MIVALTIFAIIGGPGQRGHLDDLSAQSGRLFICGVNRMPTSKSYDVASGCDGALRDYDWKGTLRCAFVERLDKCEKPST